MIWHHRPIKMSDMVARCFHHILAKRMEIFLPFNIRQKAFRASDGTAESVWFLQQLIQKHKDQLSPLNIAFVDVKKAFDSVSHQSIILAAKLGAPPALLLYLAKLYSDAWTTIRAGGERGEAIRSGRGVRQGDPMSPHLFNAVIDWVIQDLEPNIGALIGDGRTNVSAFADDLVLIAATPLGLHTLLESLDRALGLVGLEISAGPNGKSASLQIDIEGKAKRWVVNPHPSLKLARLPADAGLIPATSITQAQKYLGVEISAGAIRAKTANKLQRGLSHLSAAPLKPQQRLYILKHHLLPAFYHELVLTPCPDRYMNWLDRSIRAVLRSWLRMPKDTPTAYFHAEIIDGGLGVEMLSQTVPLIRSKRLGRLGLSDDPVILAMLEYVAARPGMQTHLQAKPMVTPSLTQGKRFTQPSLVNYIDQSMGEA